MKTKEITIGGKPVTLAYCYATEIGFNDIAGTGIENLNTSEPKHICALIMAAIIAYYESKSKEIPIGDTELIYEASPEEITKGFATVLELRRAWYGIPAGEPKDKPSKGKKGKNA